MRNYAPQAPTGKRLRRLKPRQRKKLHVGEFQQFVFEIKATYNADSNNDALLDDLIDLIESRKLYFGGSVGEGKIDGVVSTEPDSPTEEDRQAVLQWLQSRPEITNAETGKFVDAWYGWSDEAELQKMIHSGTAAWADVPNATQWVESLRSDGT